MAKLYLTDAEIGERLRLTREAMRLSQTDFAAGARINLRAYNQYEQGKKRPSIETADALCDAYNLTLDWIFRGDNANIPHALAEGIKALRKSGRSH